MTRFLSRALGPADWDRGGDAQPGSELAGALRCAQPLPRCGHLAPPAPGIGTHRLHRDEAPVRKLLGSSAGGQGPGGQHQRAQSRAQGSHSRLRSKAGAASDLHSRTVLLWAPRGPAWQGRPPWPAPASGVCFPPSCVWGPWRPCPQQHSMSWEIPGHSPPRSAVPLVHSGLWSPSACPGSVLPGTLRS